MFKVHAGVTPVLVLSAALINAVYVLAIAFKGYRIQQNALYLYDVIGRRITQITGEPFNTWDDWRHAHLSQTGRGIYYSYYFLTGILPLLVSRLVLGLYWYYERLWKKNWKAGRNFYFYFVALVNAVALVLSITLSVSVFRSWAEVRREKGIRVSETEPLSPADRAIAREALKALWKIDAATQVGTDRGQYASLTVDAAAQVSEAVALLPEEDLRGELRLAMDAYVDGKRAWDLALANDRQLPAAHPQVDIWRKKYAHQGEAAGAVQPPRDVVLNAMWVEARSHVERASKLLKDFAGK